MTGFAKCNFHTHTYRCLHADRDERAYIEKAIEMGIELLGFADHVPCPFKEPGRKSGIRMTMEQAPEYVETVRSLAWEYRDDIEIYVGFEAEYIPEFFDEQVALCRSLSCDYMIMGQHFMKGSLGTPYTGNPTAERQFLSAYVDSVIRGAMTGMFMYVAHPDLIHFVFDAGSVDFYREEAYRLCKALKDMEIPIEINNLGLLAGRHYPTPEFWQMAAQVGNDVVIGLDAHNLRDLSDVTSYQRSLHLAEKYNLNLITAPGDYRRMVRKESVKFRNDIAK